MSVLALPLRQDARVFSFTTTLSDVDFQFRFYWNDQDACWYFDLFDALATPLVRGTKVVLGAPLAKRANAGLPAGTLLAVDLSNKDREARLNDLGSRVKVMYVEP